MWSRMGAGDPPLLVEAGGQGRSEEEGGGGKGVFRGEVSGTPTEVSGGSNGNSFGSGGSGGMSNVSSIFKSGGMFRKMSMNSPGGVSRLGLFRSAAADAAVTTIADLDFPSKLKLSLSRFSSRDTKKDGDSNNSSGGGADGGGGVGIGAKAGTAAAAVGVSGGAVTAVNAFFRKTPDSDFEGFDGEMPGMMQRLGGERTEADKQMALLEHRLNGQVKGSTMVRKARCFKVRVEVTVRIRVNARFFFPERWLSGLVKGSTKVRIVCGRS
ncbi:unnamed protein product [Discosporangium mesarthrocarpum]